jgi:hypothetical protein
MSRIHLSLLYLLVIICLGLSIFNLTKSEKTVETAPIIATEQLMNTARGSLRDSVRIFDLPEELSFAGESVPIAIPDVRERLEREIYVNAYWESNMLLLMKRSSKFLPQIEQWLQENNVPDDFKYLAMAESGLMNVASSAGARGFWQFMPATAKEFGLEVSNDVDERYHFEKATKAAISYLRKAHVKFGDWTAVAASYNMGQTGFAKRQEEQLNRNYYELYLNDETSRYMFRILAFKVIFENPTEFGFNLRSSDYYQLPSMKSIRVNSDIKNLAQWAKTNGSSYKDLKQYNPWLRDKNLNIKRGRSYEILLPE